MEEAKNKIWLWPAIISAVIVLIAVVLLIAKFWYYGPAKKALESPGALTNAAESEAADLQNELQLTQKNLEKNKHFSALEKFGDWPIVLEKVLSEKSNPFNAGEK